MCRLHNTVNTFSAKSHSVCTWIPLQLFKSMGWLQIIKNICCGAKLSTPIKIVFCFLKLFNKRSTRIHRGVMKVLYFLFCVCKIYSLVFKGSYLSIFFLGLLIPTAHLLKRGEVHWNANKWSTVLQNSFVLHCYSKESWILCVC